MAMFSPDFLMEWLERDVRWQICRHEPDRKTQVTMVARELQQHQNDHSLSLLSSIFGSVGLAGCGACGDAALAGDATSVARRIKRTRS